MTHEHADLWRDGRKEDCGLCVYGTELTEPGQGATIRRLRGMVISDYPEAPQVENTLILVERELAGIMENDNPRFDRARFLAACRGEDYDAPLYNGKTRKVRYSNG